MRFYIGFGMASNLIYKYLTQTKLNPLCLPDCIRVNNKRAMWELPAVGIPCDMDRDGNIGANDLALFYYDRLR